MSETFNAQAIRFGGPADAQGKIIAEGSVKAAVVVPVFRGFNTKQVVGTATLKEDGSAEIVMAEGETVAREDQDFTIGYRVERSHKEGDVHVIDEIVPLCLGIVRIEEKQ